MYKTTQYLNKLVLIKHGDSRNSDKHKCPEYTYRWGLGYLRDIRIDPKYFTYQGVRDFVYIVDESICS